MTDAARLERRYRRLLAFYPAAFRREHEEEMLVVLMACARNGRRRPGLADCADLIRSAIWMRLRPWAQRPAPSVFWAVGLMVLGAVLELAAVATVVATQDSLRAAIVRHFPQFTAGHLHQVVYAHVVAVEIGAPIAAAVCLLMAWANGRGYGWARGLVLGFFALTSISLLSAFAQHAATYAPVDLIVGCALWLVGLIAVVLILSPRSELHYHHRTPGRRACRERTATGWPGHEHAWPADTGSASWN
jgi:hypothetical protein